VRFAIGRSHGELGRAPEATQFAWLRLVTGGGTRASGHPGRQPGRKLFSQDIMSARQVSLISGHSMCVMGDDSRFSKLAGKKLQKFKLVSVS